MKEIVESITVTYPRSNNYGAILQAYALQKTLEKRGFNNRILDFPKQNKIFKFCKKRNIKMQVAYAIMNICSLIHYKDIRALYNKFNEFASNNLMLTKEYCNIEQLETDFPEADCYISGSDQVLTLREPEFFVKARMLDFGTCKKYMYAASLADYDLSDCEKQEMKEKLSSINKISLRENHAIQYMQDFISQPMIRHIDPVFLLDKEEWEKLAVAPKLDEPYILYFQVTANENANSVLQAMQKETGLPVVCIQTNPIKRVKADYFVFDASPMEFLGWIRNASYVITTSFHGTAFSIVFRKPFYSLTKINSNPVRILDMLNRFGLGHHHLQGKREVFSVPPCLNSEEIAQIISEEKLKSEIYFEEIRRDVKGNYE